MTEFNGLKVGDRVRSHGMLSTFPGVGVVMQLTRHYGRDMVRYEDATGRWWWSADELEKITGDA